MFTPKVGEDFQFDKHIFSDGLGQPPTIVIALAPEKASKGLVQTPPNQRYDWKMLEERDKLYVK